MLPVLTVFEWAPDKGQGMARDMPVSVLDARVNNRLGSLSRRLGEAEWLEGELSAGDLMTVSVLRRMGGEELLKQYENLSAYVARGEARSAFKRAFDVQLAVFESASAAATRNRKARGR